MFILGTKDPQLPMSYKTKHRTKKTETRLKRKKGSNTERETCLKPATARMFWELTQWNIPGANLSGDP